MVSRSVLLAWDVSASQEEPWRRLLQELSESLRQEYIGARRRLGISAESIWFVPKVGGGGMAVVYLEAEDPEQALRELEAPEKCFDSWCGGALGKLFGFESTLASVRASRVAGGELLFAWHDGAPDE